jgi:predicted amidophosphoribosyltransferase
VNALDERARCDHPYLCGADQCWCLAEYLSGAGYRDGAVNQIIANFKCAPSIVAANRRRRQHKRRAVQSIAALLHDRVPRAWAESVTWVPVPPSRAPWDQDYDNRLAQVLRLAFAAYDIDVRVALYQSETLAADHLRARRISAAELYDRMRINWHCIAARPLRERLILFDDVLTTGKHYRCCERRLHAALPGVSIAGLFVARRVLSGRGRGLL